MKAAFGLILGVAIAASLLLALPLQAQAVCTIRNHFVPNSWVGPFHILSLRVNGKVVESVQTFQDLQFGQSGARKFSQIAGKCLEQIKNGTCRACPLESEPGPYRRCSVRALKTAESAPPYAYAIYVEGEYLVTDIDQRALAEACETAKRIGMCARCDPGLRHP